jgi:hypothetical protein
MAVKHFVNSTLREKVVEHVFVGDALRLLWKNEVLNVEVLRSEFDAYGYDLVMARDKIVRHIQFKTGRSNKPAGVSVAQTLGKKPSGCVIWIRVTDKLEMGPYFWFGDKPGKPLPDIDKYEVPLRPTYNKAGVRPPRPNHRLIPKHGIHKVGDIGKCSYKAVWGAPALTTFFHRLICNLKHHYPRLEQEW